MAAPYATASPEDQERKSASNLGVVALITGILSFLCLPVILAIVAIVTGFMGRKKAKAVGASAGAALAGIILGIANLIITVIAVVAMFALGVGIFNAVSGQVTVARDLYPALIAAETYGVANSSYAGISSAALAEYGYVPSPDIVVNAYSLNGGTDYCVEAYNINDPSKVVHMPATVGGGAQFNFDLNGSSLSYASGSCPTS